MVAEFTTNHLGNLNLLLRMVAAAAAAGCDLIKMQKKDVDTFYTPDKLDATYHSPYGSTYRDYRRVFEFGREDFIRFDECCAQHGVRWFATAQDVPSLHFLLKFEMPLLKVASCNARNRPFLKEVARSIDPSLPLVVSLAGSTLPEVDQVIELFAGHRLWLLHCVAEYPCADSRLRLGNISTLSQRFAGTDIKIGYSGHEIGIVPSVAAMQLGAQMVERHFCVSRHSFVHHIECSLEPTEFAELVGLARDDTHRAELTAGLDAEAYRADFGMTDEEHHFLVEQNYGRDHLRDASGFHA
jgi:N-acetylneuraminate synthase